MLEYLPFSSITALSVAEELSVELAAEELSVELAAEELSVELAVEELSVELATEELSVELVVEELSLEKVVEELTFCCFWLFLQPTMPNNNSKVSRNDKNFLIFCTFR